MEQEDENEDYQWEGLLQVFPPLFYHEDKRLVGDQIILPPALLDQFTREKFQFPLFFKAKNLMTLTTISCRAYEFTAPPGVAVFSEQLMEELFIENGTHVRLRLCQIPKATFLRLRAEGNDYLRWSNQKAVLETAIKDYGTVTLNSKILLHFNNKPHYFRVVGLRPAPHANLIDTDVTVELEDDVINDISVGTEIPTENNETKKEEPEEVPFLSSGSTSTELPTLPKPRKARRRRGEKEIEPEPETPKVTSFSGTGYSLSQEK